MGWCSGSEIAQDVWALVRKFIPDKKREKIARKLIDIFEDRDADTMDEAVQLCKDARRVYDEDLGEIVYVSTRKSRKNDVCRNCQPTGDDCDHCKG